MSFSINIHVRGYAFHVESDEKLTPYQTQLLEESLGDFDSDKLKLLSEGRKGEPPLKFIVADQERWNYMTRSIVERAIDFFVKDSAADGEYRPILNQLFLQPAWAIPKWEPHFGRSIIFRNKIKHEVAHALNDFAVTRYSNFTMVEGGGAVWNYADYFIAEQHSDQLSQFKYWLYYHYGFRGHDDKLIEQEELVASTMAYLSDPYRCELLPVMLKNFEEHDPFIQSVAAYLKSYPTIPGVGLDKQYDAGVWLPILRIRLW